MSDRQSWFHNKPSASDDILAFRGTVISPGGKEIVKFNDLWLPKSSPDTTWPLNRCERFCLSPGKYRIKIVVSDCLRQRRDASITIPAPKSYAARPRILPLSYR
jgi:hypothetical protein